ncbi:MAG: arsenate reductase ArsC [Planctomycetia bacterium]|nr:arsenate reductase ArsC [Planctomycetia bacterium]
MSSRKRVLILCTGNSARSQMAEGLWNHLAGETWEAHSAGSRPSGYVHPLAIDAMAEIGVDISAHDSKHVDHFAGQSFDLAVTVCDNARESCPIIPGANQSEHWPFDDPAAATGAEETQRQRFREIRDQIRTRIESWLSA